ncbi:MAG TPA: hypothetical protein VL332_01615 [Candidatus Saccharimonadaceae bacterium]|jgi:hypothetical protein|nr:hypothetical protein [Candidatus Saccharimonadaceae bacterium]
MKTVSEGLTRLFTAVLQVADDETSSQDVMESIRRSLEREPAPAELSPRR